MNKIEFLQKKIDSTKNLKNRCKLESILADLKALEIFKSHIRTFRTNPKITEHSGKYSIEYSYTVSYKNISEYEHYAAMDIIRWIVNNIDKKDIDRIYKIREKLNEH